VLLCRQPVVGWWTRHLPNRLWDSCQAAVLLPLEPLLLGALEHDPEQLLLQLQQSEAASRGRVRVSIGERKARNVACSCGITSLAGAQAPWTPCVVAWRGPRLRCPVLSQCSAFVPVMGVRSCQLQTNPVPDSASKEGPVQGMRPYLQLLISGSPWSQDIGSGSSLTACAGVYFLTGFK
jgi:hypothetical protein